MSVWHLGWAFGVFAHREIMIVVIVELIADFSLQAEESYIEAKQIYDELTDELYDELPSFYDRYVCYIVCGLYYITCICIHTHTHTHT